MSFLREARSIITSRPATDHLRVTLEVMIAGGHVGAVKPITLGNLINALGKRGVVLSGNGWQATVLKSSREGSCCIGSGSRGYFHH